MFKSSNAEPFRLASNARRSWGASLAWAMLLVAGLSLANSLAAYVVIAKQSDLPVLFKNPLVNSQIFLVVFGAALGIVSTLYAIAVQWLFSDIYDVLIGLVPRERRRKNCFRVGKFFWGVFIGLAALCFPGVSWLIIVSLYPVESQAGLYLYLFNFASWCAALFSWATKFFTENFGGFISAFGTAVTIGGFMMTVRQLKDFNERIMDFETLFDRINLMADSASFKDKMHIICYTPALGYLAQPESEWSDWIYFLKTHDRGSHKARIITQKYDELCEWHSRFMGRKTKKGQVTQEIIVRCNEDCLVIKERMSSHGNDYYIEVESAVLPGWYCFFTSRRAIVVTPLYLPPVVKPAVSMFSVLESQSTKMIGYETSDRNVISKLENQFSDLWKLHGLEKQEAEKLQTMLNLDSERYWGA